MTGVLAKISQYFTPAAAVAVGSNRIIGGFVVSVVSASVIGAKISGSLTVISTRRFSSFPSGSVSEEGLVGRAFGADEVCTVTRLAGIFQTLSRYEATAFARFSASV